MKEDKRIAKTKNKLTRALSILSQKKSPETITVSELCKAAGVNRATFYKYYTVPADVGRESFDRHTEALLRKMRENPGETLYATMLYCCREYRQNYLLTKQVFPGFSLSADAVQDMYMKLQSPENFSSPEVMFFIAGGAAAVIKRWLSDTPDTPAEEIAEKLTKMIGTVMNPQGPVRRTSSGSSPRSVPAGTAAGRSGASRST